MNRPTPFSMTSLPSGYRAAVLGATGAIGGAVADHLDADPNCAEVLRFGRRPGRGEVPLDLLDEATIEAASQKAAHLNLLFIATGGLVIDGSGPEKALSQMHPEALMAQFQLNAVGPALVLKHFARSLARQDRVLIGVLSARVGSIGDNQLGGWYGYRAAKAALNQMLRTTSIEMARKRPGLILAALHPGTVESPLSRPFRPGGTQHPGILTPELSAMRLLRVLDGLTPEETGSFWDHEGQRVPW